MRLNLRVISMVFLVLLTSCSGFKPVRSELTSAYTALNEGNTEGARQLLGLANNGYVKKFLHSCLELSEGNLDLAKFYAEQLVEEDDKFDDGKVLLKLIERRSTHPEERWIHAFASAWREAGSPKLNLLEMLIQEEWAEDDESCENRKIPESVQGTPDELLSAFELGLACDEERFLKLCLANTSSETPMEIRLLAFEWLEFECRNEDSKISDNLRKRTGERKRNLVRELSVELPLDIKFAVMSILDQATNRENFTQADIERLENAVARPRLAPLRTDLYTFYLQHYKSLNLQNPHLSALSIAQMVDNDLFSFDLKKKAETTAESASPEIRERLAGILEKVGRAHFRRRTILDFMVGGRMLSAAAKIRGDKYTEERIKELHTFTVSLMKSALTAFSASGYWPIHPLMLDSIELQSKDEIGVYLLLTGSDIPEALSEILSGF